MPTRRTDEPVSTDRRSCLILAGGRSARFGSDKTRVQIEGVALLDRVIGAVRSIDPPVDDILVVGPWAPEGVRRAVEPERFAGPLAALAFGLEHVAPPNALVLAADHPDLQPPLLELLLVTLATHDEVEAVVPMRDDRREPLVAAYRRSVASTAQDLLFGGVRSMRALLDAVELLELDEPEWRAVDPHGRSFRDIDHPQDVPGHDP